MTSSTDRLVRALATFFGTGHFPFAPATFASLVLTVVLFLLPAPTLTTGLVAAVAVTALAIPISTRAERFYGKDGSPIVIDEVAGMLITLLAMPRLWWVYGAGFLLFRVFDIWKPFPAGRAQRLKGGWGVVLDDVWAGLYAQLALRLLVAVLGR